MWGTSILGPKVEGLDLTSSLEATSGVKVQPRSEKRRTFWYKKRKKLGQSPNLGVISKIPGANLVYLSPILGARSKFWGVVRVGDKNFKEWRQKLRGLKCG